MKNQKAKFNDFESLPLHDLIKINGGTDGDGDVIIIDKNKRTQPGNSATGD